MYEYCNASIEMQHSLIIFTSSGDVHGVCSINECAMNCPVGQWRKECGGTSPGYCIGCSRPAEDEYHVTSGGLADNCSTEQCVTCDAGYWRSGCGLQGSDSPFCGNERGTVPLVMQPFHACCVRKAFGCFASTCLESISR